MTTTTFTAIVTRRDGGAETQEFPTLQRAKVHCNVLFLRDLDNELDELVYSMFEIKSSTGELWTVEDSDDYGLFWEKVE